MYFMLFMISRRTLALAIACFCFRSRRKSTAINVSSEEGISQATLENQIKATTAQPTCTSRLGALVAAVSNRRPYAFHK
jgi:hypothetical protein